MNSFVDIRLIEKENLHSIIPFLQMLNEKIPVETLTERLEEMVKQGYECVGVFEGDRLVGICGLWFLTKYYVGKHVEPDNVIIHPDYRGTGLGEQMMEWIYNYARSKGCVASELNCYVSNTGGQKFWINEGYKIIGFHFQKKWID
jgi:GNAT superfamily N-acetyltransferase